METIKFNPKPNQPIENWDTTLITTKMEAMAKLIANECYNESLKMGGHEYKFTIKDIYLKSDNTNLGTVEITWKK